MVEATYTEKMRKAPQFSADIVSFAWSGIGFCGLVGIFIAGPGVGYVGPFPMLAVAIPFASLILLPASLGWLTEERLPAHERGLRFGHVVKQWNYFTCTLLLTIGVIVTIFSGIMQVSTQMQLLVSTSVCTVCGLATLILLPSSISKPLIYMFLANALCVSTQGFVDNFYLDPATREESLRMGYLSNHPPVAVMLAADPCQNFGSHLLTHACICCDDF